MLRVGLTGGIGSGKSSAARCFSDLGVPVVDADAIARALTAANQPAVKIISEHLGVDVSQADGAMDRALVRKIVFADPAKRETLQRVLHPLIQAEMAAKIAAMISPYCILEIPLLVEGGKHPLVDRIAVVHAPQPVRIQRVNKRSGLSEQEILSIMQSQASDQQRQQVADDIIDNSGSLESLNSQIETLHNFYLAISG